MSHVVIRTCIGCRRRAPATELLRVVAEPVIDAAPAPPARTIVPDPRRHASGRGAWLHPTAECVALAGRRRAFERSLRIAAPVEPAAVVRYVEAQDPDRLPSARS